MNNTQLHEWEIDFQDFLHRIDLSERGFRNQLKLPIIGSLELVLPLRDIKKISSVVVLPNDLIFLLLSRVKTLDGREVYRNAKFKMLKIDPAQLKIGQKFAYRENYVQLLEQLSDIFHGRYAINSGITELGGFLVCGEDTNGKKAMAFYIPPIAEKHEDGLFVMDGIHRNKLTGWMGATINSIEVSNVSLPFPCSARDWAELKVISLTEKPESINERYFDLNKGLFRDIKYLGIDG